MRHNGKILLENYTDYNKVTKLLLLGSLSSLDKEIDIPEGVLHSYDNRVEGITVAYHRDRGEKWEYTSYEDKEKISDIDAESYHYLYFNGKWYVKAKLIEEIKDRILQLNFFEIENKK